MTKNGTPTEEPTMNPVAAILTAAAERYGNTPEGAARFAAHLEQYLASKEA